VSKFGGFPDGAVAATAIPNLFFAELLPQVDSLAELKATLEVFWRTAPGPRRSAWIAVDELRGLDPALVAGLDQAVERGTLLRAVVHYKDVKREVVAPNTPRGRRGLATLRDRAPSQDAPPIIVLPDGRAAADRPDIFALYEQNVGLVQPLIAEELRAAAELYPAAWIEEAFRRAVAYNRRNWRYVKRILERWALDGRDADPAARGGAAPIAPAKGKRQWVQTYRRDEPLSDV
jgi:DnaD/phage-associated family protein